MSDTGCPFCDLEMMEGQQVILENGLCRFLQTPQEVLQGQQVILENGLCRFLQTPQEVLQGSGVIVPFAHRETVFDLMPEEWRATQELLGEAKELLDRKFSPAGYNIGWNAGESGGQHIMHAHLHVIPRFDDEPFAGKGIRHWLKSRDNRRPGPADQ